MSELPMSEFSPPDIPAEYAAEITRIFAELTRALSPRGANLTRVVQVERELITRLEQLEASEKALAAYVANPEQVEPLACMTLLWHVDRDRQGLADGIETLRIEFMEMARERKLSGESIAQPKPSYPQNPTVCFANAPVKSDSDKSDSGAAAQPAPEPAGRALAQIKAMLHVLDRPGLNAPQVPAFQHPDWREASARHQLIEIRNIATRALALPRNAVNASEQS
jgi:hypothetical protein